MRDLEFNRVWGVRNGLIAFSIAGLGSCCGEPTPA